MNRFLTSLVLVIICNLSYSQIAIDLKAGTNASTVNNYFGKFTPHNYVVLPLIGVVLRKQISTKWDFVPELLFNGEGYIKPASDFNGQNTNIKSTGYYLNIPINFRYNIKLSDSNKLFIAAGIYGSKSTSNKYYSYSSTGGIIAIPSRSPDVGFNIGIGLRMNKATIALNYSLGVLYWYQSYNPYSYDYSLKQYNRYLSLYFAWQLWGK